MRDQRPELFDVDDGAEELVAQLVEVSHSDLAEVTRMILVEQNAVVVHASGVTSASGMLAMLADSSVAGADVTSLLPVLLESRRHFGAALPLPLFSVSTSPLQQTLYPPLKTL